MFKPTDEQRDAIEKFGTGQNLRVIAYAGTGKTATLRLMAESTRRRGQYIAFNRSAKDLAEETFPNTVRCKTNHGLAFNVIKVSHGYHEKKMTDKANPLLIAQALGLPDVSRFSETFSLTSTSYGAILREACSRFLYSDDPEPSWRHFPRYGRLTALPDSEFGTFLRAALPKLRQLWENMLDRSGIVPLGGDGYLKIWALSEPLISFDYILLDEAQDSNAVILSVLRQQKCQLVYVGDPYQQIYEWRGAVNAMEKVTAKHQAFLTESFRFGHSIATAASKVLTALGAQRQIRGNPHIRSDVCPVIPNVILCRTNFGVIGNLAVLVSKGGAKCHVLGGTAELQWMLQDVKKLRRGISVERAEFFGFANWDEVIEFSMQPEGEHLRTFVKLVNEYGEDRLLRIVAQCEPEEEHAEIILSTTHKAKGLEWDRVLVDKDFDSLISRFASFEDQKFVIGDRQHFYEEARIVYVAMTRARHAVELPPLVMSYFDIKQTRTDRILPPLTAAAASE